MTVMCRIYLQSILDSFTKCPVKVGQHIYILGAIVFKLRSKKLNQMLFACNNFNKSIQAGKFSAVWERKNTGRQNNV